MRRSMTGSEIRNLRFRVNAGFGLWQLVFGSNDAPGRENYAAARAAMMGLRADNGQIPGV